MREVLAEISQEVERIYREAIDPLADRCSFERRPGAGEISAPPTVLILGNHSSGKSTFINHLLGSEIQRTGVAPTDDAFTIIAAGEPKDLDGQAMVSNPDLPYEGLRGFGPMFLSHLRMKMRRQGLLEQVTLIDSPGMIDAAREDSGRGYDFAGVVRWFAQRADLVLIFFDPDKPGTTGETLKTFTDALQGIDHKLLIVMNKVDQFRSLRDFARAYGAICWNLGKVIPRKDLPMIYTTFVPGAAQPDAGLPRDDFDRARQELEMEIRQAPARRADNLLTQLEEHALRLRTHARVASQASLDLRAFGRQAAALIGFVVLCGLLAAAAVWDAAEWWKTVLAAAGTALAGFAGIRARRWLMRHQAARTLAGLQEIFERVYARELLVREQAEDIRVMWESVRARTRATLETLGVAAFRPVRKAEQARLDRAIETEIPTLRARLHRAADLKPVEPPL